MLDNDDPEGFIHDPELTLDLAERRPLTGTERMVLEMAVRLIERLLRSFGENAHADYDEVADAHVLFVALLESRGRR